MGVFKKRVWLLLPVLLMVTVAALVMLKPAAAQTSETNEITSYSLYIYCGDSSKEVQYTILFYNGGVNIGEKNFSTRQEDFRAVLDTLRHTNSRKLYYSKATNRLDIAQEKPGEASAH